LRHFVVTPVKNVIIGKKCFKSEKMDMFFNKVLYEGTEIEVYDISDRKQKTIDVGVIDAAKHRMIINNKKFFICKITTSA